MRDGCEGGKQTYCPAFLSGVRVFSRKLDNAQILEALFWRSPHHDSSEAPASALDGLPRSPPGRPRDNLVTLV